MAFGADFEIAREAKIVKDCSNGFEIAAFNIGY
jgi:hypothetical protein